MILEGWDIQVFLNRGLKYIGKASRNNHLSSDYYSKTTHHKLELIDKKNDTNLDETEILRQLEDNLENVIYYEKLPSSVSQEILDSERNRMSDLSDIQLIRSFKEGEESAFEELVMRYRNQVYNIILNVLHDRDLAWDGSQEIFLKLYQKIDSYQGKCPLGAWIYRITLNHALNMLRKRKKIREEVVFDESFAPAEASNGPAEMMMKDEFRNEALSVALEKLPKVQKSVIILRHFSELSFKEIADALSKREDCVKSNHYYAIIKLRNKLKKDSES